MTTREEQLAFFEGHRDATCEAAQRGPEAVKKFLRGFSEDERRLVCLLARQALALGAERDFDAYVTFYRAAVGELPPVVANPFSYNFSADVAYCWPDDGDARRPEHFEAGLEAAEACIKWREELGKGPAAEALAWWAKGMHELSLGRREPAAASWDRALELAREGEDAFNSGLLDGLIAIARGDADRFEGALAAFGSKLPDEDAQFGIDQLQTVRDRYPW